jgi:ATP-dependent Clp protease ATP-binding subunit ClpA
MAVMFERYTESARRAVFFARLLAIVSEAPNITSVNLLASLLFDDNSRAQTIFHLRESFPHYRGCPCKFASLPKQQNKTLTQHSKQALLWTAMEATQMGDYWIGTEHMLLGILRVPVSRAAKYLAMAGLTLDGARKTIQKSKSSRPDYGSVPRMWQIKAWLLRNF